MNDVNGIDSKVDDTLPEGPRDAIVAGHEVSRRSLLTAGAAAIGGAALASGSALAQPAVVGTASPWENRRFRGFINDAGTLGVADLELIWPINPKAMIIATEATQASYSNTQALRANAVPAFPGAPAMPPSVMGYIGAGTVVYAGEQVRRAQVGDRVVVGVTPQCGVCYNCLHGRPDMCQFLGLDDEVNDGGNGTFARIVADGREVGGPRNGFAELMVAYEDWVVPLFTDLPGSALSLLGSVGATGLAAPTSFVPVQPGSDVVVFGCGPIGLSMVNGAAIAGANRIIAVEPIAYRRDVALTVGATDVVDPTGKDDTLVADLLEMNRGRTRRFYAGGRSISIETFPFTMTGPDYIFEATGSQLFDPSERGIEPQPDPTGIREVQQIFQLCPGYGTIVTTGVRWGMEGIPIPGITLTQAGKRLIQGQYGGAALMRDLPRMVSMMERGQYKWDKIVTKEYALDDARKALEDSAYRTTVSAHVVFDPKQFIES